jgi:hypothetical protein
MGRGASGGTLLCSAVSTPLTGSLKSMASLTTDCSRTPARKASDHKSLNDRSSTMDAFLDQFLEDHINSGYGNILDELAADEFADEPPELPEFDEPWDEVLAQQELEDFEQADEYFGFYGGDGEW